MPLQNAPNVFALSRFLMDIVRRQNRKKVKAPKSFETLRAFERKCSGGEGGIRTHVPRLRDNPISSRARYGQLRYLSAAVRDAPWRIAGM